MNSVHLLKVHEINQNNNNNFKQGAQLIETTQEKFILRGDERNDSVEI